MHSPGTQLEQLCAMGQQEVLLVAPFIKASALARLLVQIGESVQITCVTRWRLEEILTGVSDLEVWSILQEHPGSTLWLCPDLHAKFYRADNQCLVGSANITAKALGWKEPSNLELLVPLSAHDPIAESFEQELLATSLPVDDDLYQQMVQTVALIAEQYPEPSWLNVPTETETLQPASSQTPARSDDCWLPTLRSPQDLYACYVGKDDVLNTSAQAAAKADLEALPISPGLPKAVFEASVGIVLLQKPLVRKVDTFVATPQRFGAVRHFLASLPCANHPEFEATGAWQTLMRWLRYFLPNRYTVLPSRHSEVFQRVSDR
jgi:hypothetical protein